ncbi:hypothetical protein G9464_18390 [Halostella sp. JP-L12]|uniref:type I restriction enzyme HsdR N-terminal domain-containing protein n=1 Tax=Halostella TaxID=1843185 RepID=UPI000EF7FDF1|nr:MULTISPECIES: type I restriction enzyme HsdR N-terminal domain-containing protein [Halostella]NHN49543.1 hypothetical protein [Halostella sp. JP-L12]
MNGTDLREYVERAREGLDDAASLSLRNTELRLVHPFLSTLGWDVHRPSVEADLAVPADREPVDYALLVEGRPAVFVDVSACGDPLDEAEVDRLDAALSSAGVDWGILTNGRSFAFLTRSGDDVERLRCRLVDLPDHEDVVALYSKAAAESRIASDAERAAAAERLDDRREAVARRLTETLVAAADGAADDELASATEAFLDDLVETLGGSEASPDGLYADETRSSGSETPSGRTGTPPGGSETSPEATGAPAATEDGEYIVRFFDGRTSVGAVGTATPVGTLASAVEYLIDQHAVDGGISLPWRPEAGDDAGKAVLNHDPVHPDGTPMAAHEELANGYCLLATLDAASTRVVVEELANAAGLRVMFQGDW